MRSTAAAAVAVAVLCLAAAVTAATTVLEIADDTGYVAIGASLDTTLTRKSAGTLGATNLQVDSNLVVKGSTTLGVAGAGPVTVNYNLVVVGATQITGNTTLLANAYVNGIVRHANLLYHRTRFLGITAKISASYAQTINGGATVVLGFTAGNANVQSGGGSFNDGWRWAAHNIWSGSDLTTNPTAGYSAQNGLATPSIATDLGNIQLMGYYRVTGSASFGGCTQQSGAASDPSQTTFRSLYLTQGYNSATNPDYIRHFGGTTIRELYPKEASLIADSVLYMDIYGWMFLSFTSNCASTITTRQPLAGASGLSPGTLPGPFASLSMTYVGE